MTEMETIKLALFSAQEYVKIGGELRQQVEAAVAALPAIEQSIAEHEASFSLRWKADMRAIKRWQEATGRTEVWPDHADLCVWLMDRLAEAEALIACAVCVNCGHASHVGRQCGAELPEGTPYGSHCSCGRRDAVTVFGLANDPDTCPNCANPPHEGACRRTSQAQYLYVLSCRHEVVGQMAATLICPECKTAKNVIRCVSTGETNFVTPPEARQAAEAHAYTRTLSLLQSDVLRDSAKYGDC